MRQDKNWRIKSLQTLENHDFGDPKQAPTNMVKRCLELCTVPVNKFTVEDLRLMIGQQFGLTYLIPLALEHLSQDIFIEGDYFPGDLLKNVLLVDNLFWKNHKDLWARLNELIQYRRDELVSNKIPTSSFDKVS